MKNNLLLLTAISFSSLVATATAENPVAWWEFEKTENRIVYEGISQHPDTIEGNYSFTRGVSGDAIKLDGFTSVIRHPAEASADISGSFSVETWVALGAYPWEWCPVIIQMKENTAGFSFEIGPRGEFGLKIFISGNLISCISERSAIPLRQWVHIASVYEEEKGICIYLDGVLAGEYNIKGRPAFASKEDLRIGMNYHGIKPSNQIGDTGNRPYWFSIDGILDDIKIHDEAVEADYFSELYTRLNPKEEPDLQSRIMPFGPNSQGRFDACYTKLKYYDEWDALWPVSTDPDVVVTFDESPVRVVFWRGTRYSPAWVTDNNLWMCDQSVEAWNRAEGCFEHMQDRHCRYSHVRIIENTDARKVIHWRYAPVSAYDNLWREDEKTGWAVWIDEYYYIYPDATGIRKVTWKTGTLGHPRQFQESLPLTHPGQVQGDVIEPDYLVVANLEGKTQSFEYIEDAPRKTSKTIPESPNIQKHNLKSEYDPFIIFEPGNRMNYIRDRDIKSLSSPGSCNHWPVAQAYCDGRVSQAADRPSHFLGFPISYPVIHEDVDGRSRINSVYGMTGKSVDEVIEIGRSWAQAPALEEISSGFINAGYDLSEKAYQVIKGPGTAKQVLSFMLNATEHSPLHNPAFNINSWGHQDIDLKINGELISPGKNFRKGFVHQLEHSDMIIWIKLYSNVPVKIEVIPVN